MTRIEVNDLFDIYGPLLTERQREILALSIQEDLSFGEIAAELGISRAAAADAVKRGETLLSQYEKRLGMSCWQLAMAHLSMSWSCWKGSLPCRIRSGSCMHLPECRLPRSDTCHPVGRLQEPGGVFVRQSQIRQKTGK